MIISRITGRVALVFIKMRKKEERYKRRLRVQVSDMRHRNRNMKKAAGDPGAQKRGYWDLKQTFGSLQC